MPNKKCNRNIFKYLLFVYLMHLLPQWRKNESDRDKEKERDSYASLLMSSFIVLFIFHSLLTLDMVSVICSRCVCVRAMATMHFLFYSVQFSRIKTTTKALNVFHAVASNLQIKFLLINVCFWCNCAWIENYRVYVFVE